jgi:glycosyltransferase involved in cell wall biosynthesis
MKILKVIHGYPPTYNAGSEVYSRSICEQLAQKHEIHVFTREQNDYELDFVTRQTHNNNVPVTLINLARDKDGYEHEAVNQAFLQTLKSFKPDVIHIGHLNHLSLGIVNIAKENKIPIVFTLHDFWLMCPRGQFLQRNFDGQNLYRLCDGQEDKKCATNCYKMIHSCRSQDEDLDTKYWTDWVHRRMESVRAIIPLINTFHAPSKYLMNRFMDDFHIPKNKIFYLDYGFPTHYLTPISKTEKRPFTFGYIGTHIPAKGVNLIIEAFKKIEKPSKLIIWGRPQGQNTATLKRMASDSKNPIEFIGEYQNPDIATDVFQHIDSIVVASIWGENSPLVIHEAQACHVPVITADFGGMKEYVRHQINGLLFEHRNAEDLAKQMIWAVDNSDKMEGYGKQAYLFNPDHQVPNIVEHCNTLETIYKQIIHEYATQ